MGGASIIQIINVQYVEQLYKIDPLVNLTDEQISVILLNTAGTNNTSFVNEKALKNMISKQLSYFINPSLSCVDFVRLEMAKVFDCIDKNILETLKRFPKMNADVRGVLNTLLDEKLNDIKNFIKSYIETLQMCINVSNPDFIFDLVKSSPNIIDYLKNINNQPTLEVNKLINKQFKILFTRFSYLYRNIKKSNQINMHRTITKCYFEFMRRNVRDFVPKRILHKMVNAVLDEMDSSLQKYVFTPYVINMSYKEALAEKNDVIEDRQQTMELLKAVNEALDILVKLQYY